MILSKCDGRTSPLGCSRGPSTGPSPRTPDEVSEDDPEVLAPLAAAASKLWIANRMPDFDPHPRQGKPYWALKRLGWAREGRDGQRLGRDILDRYRCYRYRRLFPRSSEAAYWEIDADTISWDFAFHQMEQESDGTAAESARRRATGGRENGRKR